MADKREEELIKKAQERFTLCQDAEHDLRAACLDDLRFLGGEQWPKEIKDQRDRDGRPCHTINRLNQFVRQITNSERQNRISALVRPVDDNADIATAEVYQGIIRSIERNSHAEDAYYTAGFHAASIGFGYWFFTTEYVDEQSFDQEIVIKRVRNPFSVYVDPSSTEPDGSDAQYAFIVEQLTKEEFKESYPNADMASLDEFMAYGDGPKDWATDSEIRVATYFHKEKKKETLVLLRDLTTQETAILLKSELPEGNAPEGFVIVQERETEVCQVKACKINAVEILEETDWPGKWIPVVKVIGSELEVNGKLQLSGVVRDTKEPQRQYNYMASAETEAIALEPKAPIIVAHGQLEGFEKDWAQANVRNFAYLQYNAVTVAGQPAAPPTRLPANPNIPALTMARAQAADDMKATAGIYDAQLGARANETSGRAILARTQQGETSNFHYADNLKRSIEHSCRILVNLIPKIYDTPRIVRIIGENDAEKVVRVNQQFIENGEQKFYDLDAGKYDVVTTSGPAYQTRRAQASEQLLALAQAYPPLMQIAGDLLTKYLDIPGAQELSNRLKKALPPQLQEEEDQQPLPPMARVKLEQQGQMIEALTQELTKLQQEKESKLVEIQSRERIAMAQIQAESTMKTMDLDSKEAIELLKVEVQNIQNQLGMNVEAQAREASAVAKQI